DPGVAGTNRQITRISGGVPRWRLEPMYRANDFSSLQAMVNEAQGALVTGVGGALLDLGENEHVLTSTLDLTKFTGGLTGPGVGKSPSHSDPGHGAVIRWNGLADQPMLRVKNSRNVIFERFRLEGNDTNPPSYGIEFVKEATDQTGVNQFFNILDMVIGKYAWSSQGTNKGLIKRGIGLTGYNGDNDRLIIDRTVIESPSEYCVYAPNTQSVGSAIRNSTLRGLTGGNTIGVGTGATLLIDNTLIQTCLIDIETLVASAIVSFVNGSRSENSRQLAQMHPDSKLICRGSYIQLQAIIAGQGVMIKASPSGRLTIVLHDLEFANNTDPASARIEIGPASPSVGRFFVDVKRCFGLQPSQLVFAPGAAMWAASPMSKGVIEWQSQNGDDVYQFRNELRTSGTGTRTTINRSVWDATVTDLSTRTNHIRNPSFETNVSSWSNSAGTSTLTRDTTEFWSGGASMKVVTPSDAAGRGPLHDTLAIAAVLGQTWTGSAYVKGTSGGTIRLQVKERTSAGGPLVAYQGPATVLDGTWQRLSMTATLTNASTAFVTIDVVTTTAAITTFFLDGAMLRQTATLGDYFDGSSPNAVWTGTAHASTSVLSVI
ncbi:MAG: carbohydrate binding domain-containing protein, partial [Chloroflexota bacterium]|nr:carbohydrate binding domain-containing protein [Chloroflexota bacterium]